MEQKRVDIDVVIPTFRRPERINETLEMLLQQLPLPKRVIVVNQTPGITSAPTEIKKAYENEKVDLVWINRREPSLCGARNDALCVAKSSICLFLDDDILIPYDLVGKHCAYFMQHQNITALGGQVLHRNSLTAIRALTLQSPELGTTRGCLSTKPLPAGPLFGGHFSIRRETALEIGGWDESFIGSANWEEGDLMNRLIARGLKFLWHPNIWLLHLREPTGGCRIPGNSFFPEWTKTVNYFLYKYRYPKEKSWDLVLWSALRSGPLRKEIIKNPLRWPTAWSGFVFGWIEGYRRAKTPSLPFLLCKMSTTDDKGATNILPKRV